MLEFHSDGIYEDPYLTDTLLFDTILVEFGSVTKYFKVVNPHNDAINISTIQLMGGDDSQFRINVDGVPGSTATDVVIEPQDSIYVFAEVTIDPGDIDTPFIVEDSVQFNLNGNLQYVKLLAYGQNAHFHFGDTLEENTDWIDDKPHVIVGYTLIDTLVELNIREGVNVYLHNRSAIIAKGNLNVYGKKDSIVTFSSTRLEHRYQDVPGQWLAIFLSRNTNSYLENFEIRNAVVGLSIGSDFSVMTEDFNYDNATNATLKCGIIRNSFGPKVVLISNFLETFPDDETTIINAATMNATFNNSIVHGTLEQELAYVTLDDIKEDLNITFNHCLLKDTMKNDIVVYENCIFNENPLYMMPDSLQRKEFNLTEDSPCIDKGAASDVLLDLSGKMRSDGMPDIGCYEFE